MKIMHIIHGLNTGGAETLVKNYALNINKNLFEVVILCFEHYFDSPYEAILKKNNIKVIYIADYMRFYGKKGIVFKLFNYVQKYYLIKKNIHKENADILHTHLKINSYIKFSCPSNNTKIFHTVHSEPIKIWPTKYDKDFKAAKWMVKKYNMQFITLHENMRKEVNNLFGVDNTLILNNGIDFSIFRNVKLKSKMKEKLEIPKSKFIIGHIGRFCPEKNHEFLIKVFKKVHDINKNAFLLMIGDGNNKQKIQEMLFNYNLKSDFVILSNRTDIPDLLNILDVFVFPSISEGLGIALIEAQESKIPCIVSNQIPRHAIISNFVTQLDLSNIDKWVKAILTAQLPDMVVLKDEDWNIKQVVNKLEKIYLGK